jgi:hypothetical protein
MSVGPGYDAALIVGRPKPRPRELPPLPEEGAETWISPERWLKGLEGSEERLARQLPDGWIVIGERTELRRLDHEMPRELRSQSLGLQKALDPEDRADEFWRCRLSEIDRLSASLGSTPLIYHSDISYRGPSDWMALHPRLAEACGWQRDETKLIAWRDNEGPVVQSLWWRSGWLGSSHWTGHEEVGEGWLIVARERVLELLADALGGDLGLAWQVQRDFLVTGYGSNTRAGVRAVVKAS